MSYSSINRVVLVGRLTADPDLRALPSGATVCNLRLACSGVRKGEGGEYTEKPNFFNVSVFGAHGETVHRYMRRGKLVGVDGRLRWHDWETPEGLKRQAVEIVADRVQFLERADGVASGSGVEDGPADGSELQDEGERELVGVGAGSAIEDDIEF